MYIPSHILTTTGIHTHTHFGADHMFYIQTQSYKCLPTSIRTHTYLQSYNAILNPTILKKKKTKNKKFKDLKSEKSTILNIKRNEIMRHCYYCIFSFQSHSLCCPQFWINIFFFSHSRTYGEAMFANNVCLKCKRMGGS